MSLHLGDLAPDFTADTTHGPSGSTSGSAIRGGS